MGEEIRITYESLFDILRREKNKDELQKLDSTFFDDVITYLEQKQEMIQQKVSAGMDDDQAKLQLQNIKKVIKEIYERRERKIANMALHKARLSDDMVLDMSSLLTEEQALYNELVDVLTNTRKDVLQAMLDIKRKTPTSENTPVQEQKDDNTAVTFLKAVPQFLGKNSKVHGPYQPGDTAELPPVIANILVSKGLAELSPEQAAPS
ncbi:MAG: hypothetical protein V1725_03970 [archaeon]